MIRLAKSKLKSLLTDLINLYSVVSDSLMLTVSDSDASIDMVQMAIGSLTIQSNTSLLRKSDLIISKMVKPFIKGIQESNSVDVAMGSHFVLFCFAGANFIG